MSLKSNLYRDSYGNIHYKKIINGVPIVLTAHTKSTKIANKLHQALEHQAIMQYYEPINRPKFVTFRKLVELYLNDKNNIARLKPYTLKCKKSTLSLFLKDKTLPENRESRISYQRVINAVINWGIKNNMGTDVEKFKLEQHMGRQRVFTDRELNIIMNEFQDDNFQRFTRFSYYTGARRGEIASLKPYQIEPAQIKVKGKTGNRVIKLNAQARSILMEQEKLWDYLPDFITHTFKKNCRKLEIRDARFHDLRRTFGLNVIKSGMPIFKVSKLLGHSSVKITEKHYAPLLVSDIEDFEI